jgi:hypothetical protein
MSTVGENLVECLRLFNVDLPTCTDPDCLSLLLLRHVQSFSAGGHVQSFSAGGHIQSLRTGGHVNSKQQPTTTSNEDAVYVNTNHNSTYANFKCDDGGIDSDFEAECSMCPECVNRCQPGIQFDVP